MYRLIKVSGNDAATFLQGQLTQDIGLLSGSGSLPAAWCNPQGRVIATIRLIALPDAIGLAVPAEITCHVCERLARFRLRSDVDMRISTDGWTCIAVKSAPGTDVANAGESLQGNQLTAVAYASDVPFTELYGATAAMPAVSGDVSNTLSVEDWKRALIHAGVPVISSENSEKFTPHMLNLDRLGAISFSKGCYTGQEVVARTEHLGSSKRRLMHYYSESDSVAVGDKLADDGKNVAEVVNVAGDALLAVAPVALHDQPLTINGVIATPIGLPY